MTSPYIDIYILGPKKNYENDKKKACSIDLKLQYSIYLKIKFIGSAFLKVCIDRSYLIVSGVLRNFAN